MTPEQRKRFDALPKDQQVRVLAGVIAFAGVPYVMAARDGDPAKLDDALKVEEERVDRMLKHAERAHLRVIDGG